MLSFHVVCVTETDVGNANEALMLNGRDQWGVQGRSWTLIFLYLYIQENESLTVTTSKK